MTGFLAHKIIKKNSEPKSSLNAENFLFVIDSKNDSVLLIPNPA